MSSTQGYDVNSPSKGTTATTQGTPNVQYASLSTEPSRPSRKQRSDDTLKAYVDKVLNENKVFSTLHKIRTKIMRYYAPVANAILAIVFIMANRKETEKACDEYTVNWSLWAMIYFVCVSISEITNIVVEKTGSKIFEELQKDLRVKMLFSSLNTVELVSNFVVNIALFYAFIDRDQCPALSPYLLAWGAFEFLLGVASVITLALTLFTLVTYMHYEKKRLD